MSKHERYFSIDVETDGPAPGLNSMIAIGAAAYSDEHKGEISTFYAKLHPLPDAATNPGTMEWWATQPKAWAEVTSDQWSPESVMPRFVDWVNQTLDGNRAIAVAWPASFDAAFVNYYCHRFAGSNPLGFSCLDIRSFANGLTNNDTYYGLSEKKLNALALDIDKTGLKSHFAVDDAIEQGRLWMALRAIAKRRTADARR